MDKLKKIERLNELRKNGSLTDEEFEAEKKKLLEENGKKNNVKVPIIVAIVAILCVAAVVIFLVVFKGSEDSSKGENIKNSDQSNSQQVESKKENEDAQDSESDANTEEHKNNDNTEISFSSMNADDDSYTELQKDIIDYFDYDYFPFSSEYLQRYPQIFNKAKVSTIGVVVKVIDSNDDNYKVVVAQGGGKSMMGRSEGDAPRIYDQGLGDAELSEIDEKILFILQGSQINKRFIKGDVIQVYGRYDTSETTNIDGRSYTLPLINSITSYQLKYEEGRFAESRIRNIAESILGKDIKISKNAAGVEGVNYKIVMDNQSNGNFKAFIMNDEGGPIRYDEEYNNIDYNVSKKLWVGADFEHYLVTTFDDNSKHAYLEAFDKSLSKMWSREFDFNDNNMWSYGPIDYTNSMIAIVVDNDLYVINAKTGENIIEPMIVGNKIRVDIMDDGILMIGNNNKDAIMKVSFDGQILYRHNAESDIDSIYQAYTQKVEDKMVVYLDSYEGSKFVLLDSEGNIESISNDFE